MNVLSRILPNERARHLVIAAATAILLSILTISDAVDRLVWVIESRLVQHEASGEIILVTAQDDLTDPSRPDHRVRLANVLDKLHGLGAEQVVLDMVFENSSTPNADDTLAKSIGQFGSKLKLIQRVRSNTDGSDRLESSLSFLARDAEFVVAERYVEWSGFTWTMSSAYDAGDKSYPAYSATLADTDKAIPKRFAIDYNIDASTIPQVRFSELTEDDSGQQKLGDLTGKTVVIGLKPRSARESASIPGHLMLSESHIHILAAETLKKGVPGKINWAIVLLAFASILALASSQRGSTWRRNIGYACAVFSLPAYMYFCASTGRVAYLGAAIAMVVIFGMLRIWSRRKRQQVNFDEALGMPTFVAMERDLNRTGNVRGMAVVVAKLHRFDEVTSTLSDEATSEYIRQISNRFRIAEQDLQVYTKGGKYLAWITETGDRDMLESHLRGLRAVFAHPLIVNNFSIDVGITFAADLTPEVNAARKIASASSAVEKTTEAHEPVLFAEMASEGDRWWNISLQAKIDEALENGHIYVVFQPKLNVRQGTVVGAEALVRWKDPERGNIAPNYFIEQCENAGRMDHLTRHVLRESLLAAKEFAKTNSQFTISVNISATMLRDYRVAEMVEEIVEKTGYSPRNLVLEITETSRIADYDIAYDVMTRLRLHGIKLSIDDFGVGSASMETLLRLPFDELKIDRAFIARMQDDQKARAISQMMIAFGKQTRISVVAEGVEDESNLSLLRDLGCEIVQGYHISKPLEKENFAQFQLDNKREFSKQAING